MWVPRRLLGQRRSPAARTGPAELHTRPPAAAELHTRPPAAAELHTIPPAAVELHTRPPAAVEPHTRLEPHRSPPKLRRSLVPRPRRRRRSAYERSTWC